MVRFSRNQAPTKAVNLVIAQVALVAIVEAIIIKVETEVIPNSTISHMQPLNSTHLTMRMRTPSGTISIRKRKLAISLEERSLKK